MSKIKELEDKIEKLETEFNNYLKCTHEMTDRIISIDSIYGPIEYCSICHKKFVFFDNEIQALKARNDLMKNLININEKIIRDAKSDNIEDKR